MHAFDNLFTTAYAKAGAVVVGRTPITGTPLGRATRTGRARGPDSRAAAGQGRAGVHRRQGADPRRQRRRNQRPRLADRAQRASRRQHAEHATARQRTFPERARPDRARRADRQHEPLPPRLDDRRRGSPPAASGSASSGSCASAVPSRSGRCSCWYSTCPSPSSCSTSRASTTRSTSPPDQGSARGSLSARLRRCSPPPQRSRRAPNRCRRRLSTSRRAWRSFATSCSRSARSRCSSERS